MVFPEGSTINSEEVNSEELYSYSYTYSIAVL